MKKMRKMLKQLSGFTLLEIIIVIIIIGVLASLAMPRFFRTIEYSKGQEALTSLSVLRQAMNRCYLMDNSYTKCNAITQLDVDDPGSLTGAHFAYSIPAVGASTFTLRATRNTFENGDGTSTISINEAGTKSGTTIFAGIR